MELNYDEMLEGIAEFNELPKDVVKRILSATWFSALDAVHMDEQAGLPQLAAEKKRIACIPEDEAICEDRWGITDIREFAPEKDDEYLVEILRPIFCNQEHYFYLCIADEVLSNIATGRPAYEGIPAEI